MSGRLLQSAAVLLLVGFTQTVGAQTQYEHCNKALEKDVYNIVTSSSSESSSATEFTWQKWLSLSEQDAFAQYGEYYDSQVGQKSGGEVNAVIKLIPIEAKGNHEYNRKLSREQFGSAYRRMKSLNEGSSQRQSSSQNARVGEAASYIRDPGLVRAWEACVSKDPSPGLYLYGFRDAGGNTFVKVVWTPGQFAGTAPRVDIEFVERAGLSIDAPRPVTIATGSGRTFAVKTEDANGFEIHVNGTISDRQVRANFTQDVAIPPRAPGKLAFQGGGSASGGCAGSAAYPLGRWTVTSRPSNPGYNTFVRFTDKTSGTWLPSGNSPGIFTVSRIPTPGEPVVLTYRVKNSSYTSVNTLLVSADGCSMEGTFQSAGGKGEVRYDWDGKK